jgi:hypothetical protein
VALVSVSERIEHLTLGPVISDSGTLAEVAGFGCPQKFWILKWKDELKAVLGIAGYAETMDND